MLTTTKHIIILLTMGINAYGQSFFTSMEADENTLVEYTFHYSEVQDTLMTLGVLRGANSIYFQMKFDQAGNRLSTTFTDTLSGSPRDAILTSDSILMPDYYTELDQNTVVFDIFDSKGDYLGRKRTEILVDSVDVYYIDQATVHNNFIVLSGTCEVEDQRRGIAVWISRSDYQVENIEVTNVDYRMIGGVTSHDGRLYGVAASRRYDPSNCAACLTYAKFYICELNIDTAIDTLFYLGEGDSYSQDFTVDLISSGEYLVLSHALHDIDQIDTYDPVTNAIIKTVDQFPLKNKSSTFTNAVPLQDSKYLHFKAQGLTDDVDDRVDPWTRNLSLIDSEGNIEWTRKFIRYNDEDKVIYDVLGSAAYENDDYYFIPSIEITIDGIEVFLLKITKDGCYTEECGEVQVIGRRPKPKHMVSSRNVWHMHNTDTDERYRYTFVDQYLDVIGGTLLRSDDMDGNDWYDTGRRFSGGIGVAVERFDEPTLRVGAEYFYSLAQWEASELVEHDHFVRVHHKDTIQFLDGRPMRRLQLHCYKDGEVQEGKDTITWIEYLGEPNHLFDTKNACDTRTNEVVTCFYSADELMWTNPRSIDCSTVSTTEVQHDPNPQYLISPNPTSNYITINADLEDYRIVNSKGQIVSQAKRYLKGDQIDISHFAKGIYYLYTIDPDGRVIMTFSKL